MNITTENVKILELKSLWHGLAINIHIAWNRLSLFDCICQKSTSKENDITSCLDRTTAMISIPHSQGLQLFSK